MSIPQPISEHELILQVTQGNQSAFGLLFNKYHQQLGTYIFRLTDSMEMAEEIVQDVFVKIWANREALCEIQCFKAYLFVMSKNQALNCIKKTIREQKHQTQWREEEGCEEQLVLQKTEIDNYYALLDIAIDHLPPQQQRVYLLSRHDRLKYAEIAQKMNLSRETVKKYLQLAVSHISAYLENHSGVVI
ncbi:MAG: RNA polymerase sigma-70 factor [Mucilaginibacter sp.]|uniref:RNA polymerase sigma factor n=1 Tax=Mucilaginibacter sp. TaxID=1882438 RepID=UPI0032643BB1